MSKPWYVKILAIPALIFATITSAVILAFCRLIMRGNEAVHLSEPSRRVVTTSRRSSPSTSTTASSDDSSSLTNAAVVAVTVAVLSDTGGSYSPSDFSGGASGGASIDSSSF